MKTIERRVYLPDELCVITGLSRAVVYQALRHGVIPSVRIGKRYVIARTAFDRWFEESAARQLSEGVTK